MGFLCAGAVHHGGTNTAQQPEIVKERNKPLEVLLAWKLDMPGRNLLVDRREKQQLNAIKLVVFNNLFTY